MKRLTERDEYGNADIIALSDMMPELYAGLSFSETNALTDVLNRLADYEDAEEDGRLMELPCKVGDVVYQTDGISIYDSKVRRIVFDTDGVAFDERAIGTSVFLTREEAEAALEARKGAEHEGNSV